jgi:hypothetical protein
MADRTWTAPVLEELSIPAGTYGSDDQGDMGSGNPDQGTTIS